MGSIFRQYKNRLQCSTKRNSFSIDNELKNINNILDKLLNENQLLKNRFDTLEERYQQWIDDERVYLLIRIEKLENENHQLHQIYQTYQIQNDKSIRSITNLTIKILLNQQELRKQYIEQHNANDPVQWRNKRQQDESITHNTRSTSCHFASNQLNDSRYTINDQPIWFQQIKEQDQKTTNDSSELNNHSSTLATVKSKSEKSSTALANKLYYVLNNEKTPTKSIRDNHHSTAINNSVPVNDSNIIPHRKQQSSVTFNKNQSQIRSTYPNHERLPTQTSNRTAPIVKNTQTKTTTTSVSKPPRVPTITIRPTTTNTRQRPPPPPPPLPITNRKTVSSSSTTNKSPRPHYTLPKSSESIRSVGTTTTRPRSGQPITNKPTISPTKPKTNNIKTRIPIVTQQSARVTDLDVLMAKQQNENSLKLSDKRTIISPALFSTNTIKLVRPVRSEELKLFSCHLIPEISIQTNQPLSTITPASFESKTNNQLIEKKNDYSNSSSNILGVIKDFSEDSLNEHNHIQQLFRPSSIDTTKNDNPQDHSSSDNVQISSDSISIEQENIEMNITEGYFLSIDDNLNPPYAPPSSLIKPKSISSVVHRLVFPARLGRMIFFRRILSDSDIYQKNCSKDSEILHNVYHLDTIRDYSMEFYMLTTYASDSQLRAWIDSDDNEIVSHLNENRFLSSDGEIDENQMKRFDSSDSLIQDEELDWYSEFELLNQTKEKHENTSNDSSEIHIEEFLPAQQTFTNTSWTIPPGASNQLYSTPVPSDVIDQSNSILREILNHSWTDHLSTSNSIQQETGIEQFENDSTSSIIPDEFQPDFYYLCPITKTTSFSKIDYKT